MTFTKTIEGLEKKGMDTIELESILNDYKCAETYNDMMFYQGQIYGVLCGMAALLYISMDEVFEIMDNLEAGEI